MDTLLSGYFEGECGAQVPLPVERLRQRKAAKWMGLETRSLLAASLIAADRAGLPDAELPSCGVCVAAPPAELPTPLPAAFPMDVAAVRDLLRDWPPLWLLGCLPNMAASHLAIQFRAGGPCHTLATSSWEEITRLASAWLLEGEADRVIACGRGGDGRVRAAVFDSSRPRKGVQP
ncbi:MAG: beta-ketoacyl synthase N-terminal-like domain-containing protein [Candidatus Methylacidiphilales bacterium]|nr:beta-ketoacyl synthase N-terminal-like domain-containing protein [Candidatus Methylacidiphilales bacterium]